MNCANTTQIKAFQELQKLPYREKVQYAAGLAQAFYEELNGACYVAVGGLDSITLYLFLRSLGIDVPGISVSSLEDVSIQKVHSEECNCPTCHHNRGNRSLWRISEEYQNEITPEVAE